MANTSNVLLRTREIAVATDEFQSWIGLDLTADITVRKAAARERVFRWRLDGWARGRMPCMLVCPTGYNGIRGSSGGGSFRYTQGVSCVFFAELAAIEKAGYETHVSALEAFDSAVLGIVQAMARLSGSADHIEFGSVTQALPPEQNGWDVIDTDTGRGTDRAGFPYIVTVYNFSGVRYGETAL
jgi:hypothetical protein